ncbi:MAG: DNA repair protein RadA [Acidimicrobiales bacterium]
MARPRNVHVCRECGEQTAGWAGRCPGCGAWASIEEVQPAALTRRSRRGPATAGPRSLAEVDGAASIPTPTGVDEVDRVLGGGLTAGSATLLGGEPGVGKSTLTLQIGRSVAAGGAAVLLVAGEEAPAQIATRAARLGPVPPTLAVIDDLSVDAVIAAMDDLRPQVIVIDSIQSVRVDAVDGTPGSIPQLRAAAERLVAAGKRFGVSVVMIGHLTKDGSLAGPRVIEHLVDTVLSFGGDRTGELRYLRTVKHRFGPTTDVGLFEMTAAGLATVADPSGRFLTDRQPGLPGSVVVATVEGRRPVLVEVQALTVDVGSATGSTTVQGIDGRRLAMVAAVLGRRVGLSLARHQLFVSSTGGADVTEPGGDLALALALVSSATDRPYRPDLVACGEIGLGGELRSVPLLDARLQEAYRLGFRTAIVPASAPNGPTGMTVLRAQTVSDALGLVSGRPSG